MLFIKFKTSERSIKLLNADSIREAEFDKSGGTLRVMIGTNGEVEHLLHGQEAREAFNKSSSYTLRGEK